MTRLSQSHAPLGSRTAYRSCIRRDLTHLAGHGSTTLHPYLLPARGKELGDPLETCACLTFSDVPERGVPGTMRRSPASHFLAGRELFSSLKRLLTPKRRGL
jgi:hypothetical protein